jgi:hypothetical protein
MIKYSKILSKLYHFISSKLGIAGYNHKPARELLNNIPGVQFLSFGFSFEQNSFEKTIGRLSRIMSSKSQQSIPSSKVKPKPDHVEILKEALIRSTRRAIESSGANDVRMGITGGIDSRLLYSAVREILPSECIFTYTLGYRGQYDYEYALEYSHGFLPNHRFFETKTIEWDIWEEIDHKRRASRPTAYSAKRHLYDYMTSQLGAPTYNIHGFTGDTLVGATKPDNQIPIKSWNDAVQRFIKKNDRFKLQDVFLNHIDLLELMPNNPKLAIDGLDDYDLLDFGLRQYQRILGVDSRNSPKTIIPYTDEIWISAVLSVGKIHEREGLYYDFLARWAPDIFSEIVNSQILSRAQHQQFRERIMNDAVQNINNLNLKNTDGSPYRQQVTTTSGRALPGRQFCEYAEYYNSPSFKQMVDVVLTRLRARKLIPHRYLDDTYTGFVNGDLSSASKIKGLVSYELNLSAGHFNNDR